MDIQLGDVLPLGKPATPAQPRTDYAPGIQ